MKDSPFIYGTTVSTHAFTNREAEAAKLRNNLLNGINTIIISPRRWGKSSLVEKVVMEINKKEKKTKTVIIDLFTVGSEEEFLEMFAREVIKASSPKWQEWLASGKEFFNKLIPKLSIGLDPTNDFSLSFDWKELKKNSEEVLNLPETIGKKKGLKFIICLDEFQNISSFNGYADLEKKLRSYWQRQKLVTYCLYGSKRHMMTEIFNNAGKPFYRFGDIMLLPKIETKKWVAFITKGFQDTGKFIDEKTAERIAGLMKNHSWYVQQLAHYTWNLTHKKASVTEINNALTELIYANTPLYQNEIENISITQLNFLKAVVKGETQFTSAAVMNTYALGTPRNVSKNKSLLINTDLIHEIDGIFQFVDPAFELWFRKQFLNQSYLIE
ncbi:MAG: AAA family ATPase [Cytophaga sp.]|uniref:AAA family ATPase n=1 Tax=Cytophaga sp. TaxID=29535 RepID=UPI003F7F7C87